MRGFTLIEILIYSVIVTVIFSFSLLAVYQIIDFNERVFAWEELTANQKFLLQKISWVLQNVDTVNSPVAGAGGPGLSVNKLNYSYNPLVISLDNGAVKLTSGATATPLTNDYVNITGLNFEHLNFYGKNAIRVAAILENKFGTTTINAVITVK